MQPTEAAAALDEELDLEVAVWADLHENSTFDPNVHSPEKEVIDRLQRRGTMFLENAAAYALAKSVIADFAGKQMPREALLNAAIERLKLIDTTLRGRIAHLRNRYMIVCKEAAHWKDDDLAKDAGEVLALQLERANFLKQFEAA